ncbi:MAG: hypothetical protein ONB23_05360 [candidate division KSB1 bacterium]|nr:hypothetical protein [candidate division KSB1 bacterium]
MPVTRIVCYRCGKVVEFTPPLFRMEVCESCLAYLRCCRNCRFYDAQASGGCREPQAERVLDKEAANACEFFEPNPHPSSSEGDRADEARKKLEALFRKRGQGGDPS